MTDLKAYCGLDCASCDAYLATKNDDDSLRVKTAKKWTELNGVEILPKDINCQGCKCQGTKTIFCENLCEIRKCAITKQTDCKDCNEYKTCTKVEMIRDHSF